MLTNLSIKNYALIEHLNVSFGPGFTVITGETGAGKSILLGGLSLVLGKRADLSALRDNSQKCVIEAEFNIEKYDLQPFFNNFDLDYEPVTLLRREIQPSGKSRAFINDSPVKLDVLSQLGEQLIDVHSQHQTLRLTENDFQLKVIDALADNGSQLADYTLKLMEYQGGVRALDQMVKAQAEAIKEYDYHSFLLEELNEAPLKLGIQEELEERYGQLNNVEVILEQFAKGHQLVSDEQVGVLTLLTELKQVSGKLASFGKQFEDLDARVQSVFIEMDDISGEILALQEGLEADPKLLEETTAKLQLLYDLQKKHAASTISELIQVRDDLSEKVGFSERSEDDIKQKRQELTVLENQLNAMGLSIRSKREKAIPILKKKLEENLKALGMPNARFLIELSPAESFKGNGMDDLNFRFSANKGTGFGMLKKVASGGELSRIMLTIKSILGAYENLPTMMFDEIDSGVSGEISNRMGDIMKNMSANMQVFAITHLPQVASKGDHHYKVFKDDSEAITITKMKALDQDERVVELAEMLGGNQLSDSAMAHARELLN